MFGNLFVDCLFAAVECLLDALNVWFAVFFRKMVELLGKSLEIFCSLGQIDRKIRVKIGGGGRYR
ncbi:MAG: hypothetical protein LBP87_14405 [Planctomycetaceae bacterium]|nr:hypothetical protein [Planctomycetaceae bacterium]